MKSILTDRQLAALAAPAARRLEVADGTGLVVRVTANGTKTFGVWWRIPKKFGGTEHKGFYTIGTTAAVTLGEARRQAKEILELARSGVSPVVELKRRAEEAQAEAVRRAGLTVMAVVERHLDARRATLRPATLSQYEYTIKTLRESPLATRQLLHRGTIDHRRWSYSQAVCVGSCGCELRHAVVEIGFGVWRGRRVLDSVTNDDLPALDDLACRSGRWRDPARHLRPAPGQGRIARRASRLSAPSGRAAARDEPASRWAAPRWYSQAAAVQKRL